MTKKEYLKYNNPTAYDKLGKHVKPGDTVVFNNHYEASPNVGVVNHYTPNGRLAILFDYIFAWKGQQQYTTKCWAYRYSNTVIKIKNGHKFTSKNKNESKP